MARVFNPDELVYASSSRCRCGAGLCYVRDREARKEETGDCWVCSAVLTSDKKIKVTANGGLFGGGMLEDEDGIAHNQSYPFVSYEIKSENQPSAYGATTRPKKEG